MTISPYRARAEALVTNEIMLITSRESWHSYYLISDLSDHGDDGFNSWVQAWQRQVGLLGFDMYVNNWLPRIHKLRENDFRTSDEQQSYLIDFSVELLEYADAVKGISQRAQPLAVMLLWAGTPSEVVRHWNLTQIRRAHLLLASGHSPATAVGVIEYGVDVALMSEV